MYERQERDGGYATTSCPLSWPTPGERWESLQVACSLSSWWPLEDKDIPVITVTSSSSKIGERWRRLFEAFSKQPRSSA